MARRRVPPRWAIWLPSGVEHELTSSEHLRLFSIYLEPEDAVPLPAAPCIVRIPGLLAALIEESNRLPELYDEAGADGRLVAALIDELSNIVVHPLPVTVPDTQPLATLYEHYCRQPDSRKTLDAWASELGLTRRTLTRVFQRDLGLDFRTWRTHLKLQAALEMLNRDVPVGIVSAELGYASASAFSASFRRHIGSAPTAFVP